MKEHLKEHPQEHPLLFTLLMVWAILAGRKTQTRRAVKFPAKMVRDLETPMDWAEAITTMNESENKVVGRRGPCDGYVCRWACPYGKPGDVLWLKETWQAALAWCSLPPRTIPPFGSPIWYEADGPKSTNAAAGWRSSLFMPRWASRILLRIVSIRIERVQDITEADALAEGIAAKSKDGGHTIKYGLADRQGMWGCGDKGDPSWVWRDWCGTAREAYAKLYDAINGDGAWARNDYVWVIEFAVHSVKGIRAAE